MDSTYGRRRSAAPALLLAAAFSASSAAGTLTPAGVERTIDSQTTCDSSHPDLAAVAGGYVAVWNERDHLALRHLDLTGAPVGPLQTVANGAPQAAEVVALPDGIGVAWFDRLREVVLARRTGPDGQLGPELELGPASAPGSGFGGLDAAATASGSLAVAWGSDGALYLREVPDSTGALGTQPFVVEAYGGVLGVEPLVLDPVVLAPPDGTLRIFWIATSSFFGDYEAEGSIDGRVLDPSGDGDYHTLRTLDGLHDGSHLEGAMAADGSYLLAWLQADQDVQPSTEPNGPFVVARSFTADDLPLGPAVRVDEEEAGWKQAGGVAATALPGGGFVVAWHEGLSTKPSFLPDVYGREVASDASPVGAQRLLASEVPRDGVEPTLTVGPNGLLLAAWRRVEEPPILPNCSGGWWGSGIVVRPFSVDCGLPGAFCVDDGRFRISLTYADPRRGLAGSGNGVALTGDSGYFWFFAPDNVEVVVKVLDGRATNGHYWVFYGGLTDVGFTLEVTDTATARTRQFVHPAGELASRGITNAFPGSVTTAAAGSAIQPLRVAGLVRDAFPGGDEPSRLAAVDGRATAAATALGAPQTGISPCSPPELPVVPGPGLCLEGRRFAVTAAWRDFAGGTGIGHGVPLGDDSGYFWFFSPDNVELVVKVLDGRALNNRFWVFYGALSNVEYDLEVRHVFGDDGGADGEATYHNPSGTFASVADIDALRPPDFGAFPIDGCSGDPDVPVCGRDGRAYANACEARWLGWVEVAPFGSCP